MTLGRKHGKRVSLVLLAVALALAAAGCGGDDGGGEASSEEPVTIGSAIAMTGGLSSFDKPALDGTRIAIEEINAAGGIMGRQVKSVTADTKSDINQGARAGQEVIQKGADAMITTLDFNYGGGAAREAQKKGIIAIAPGAGSPKYGVQGIGDMAYTLGIAAQTDAAVAAEWGIEDKKFKTAYLLLDDITD